MTPADRATPGPGASVGEELRGTTVLLTGVGRPGQLGEVVADVFARRGTNLLLVAHHADHADRIAQRVRVHGIEVHPFACDLTDATAVNQLAGRVAGLAPQGLAALVHMAGGYLPGAAVADMDLQGLDVLLSINATTAFVTSHAFLPLVRQARGSMVFFASTAALPGAAVARMSAYAAAKSAVATLMRAIAAEERDAGVRANALAPLAIRTASNERSMGPDHRYVERETVAEWVWWLCSATAGPVSGQLIRLG